jgi:hypothetical protein
MSSENSPKAVVRSYIDALDSQNYEAALRYLDDKTDQTSSRRDVWNPTRLRYAATLSWKV